MAAFPAEILEVGGDFLFRLKNSAPKSPADFLKAISKAHTLTVVQLYVVRERQRQSVRGRGRRLR